MAGSGRPRHRARGEERRQEILRATFEVIAERGYRGTTLAAVAERAGLTQQGLLHYFPTKEALLVAVLEERDAWDTGGAPAREERHGAERVWPLGNLETLVEYNAMRPAIVRTFSALLGESVTDDHPARDYFTERYAWAREAFAATLRQEYGERLPGSGLTPEQAAPLMAAVMDGLQFQWLLDPEAVDMPASFRRFRALLGDVPEPGAT
ncbi:TetR/AcrR family transcriptional regulator [Streptomyces sp. HNM0574]|uniref:TetR family transcriptional regulator n=1 Tax=Streptomyces sp. HNM0574 TaxID=2714954 RepID=UPI00146B8BDC|nr:TetR/AcrR family transcriptional regulator [Streptomyces sp. HNM0574]